MKKKQNQKQTHSQKAQNKKAIDSRRKKINKQNRKIKKRSKAAKIVNSKKHNRRFSDHAPLILSPVMPEIPSIDNRPIILPPKHGSEDTETLLTRQALLEILGSTIFKSLIDLNFDINMLITDHNLDKLEKKLESNQEKLKQLANIKIGQD